MAPHDYSYTPELEEYQRRNPRSAARFAAAQHVLAGGNSRLTAYFAPFPFYVERGAGYLVYDIDGNSRLDFYNNATSLILGHSNPQVSAAIIAQAEKGTAFANPTDPEVELATLLTAALPSVQRLRFTNSGTEGVALAIRAARAFTGKPKIAKLEGAYHGTSDHVSVSVSGDLSHAGSAEAPQAVPSSSGITANTLADVVVIPFNNAAAARRIIAQHRDELAAVLIEPVLAGIGYVPAEAEFLESVREACNGQDTLLIFDEVQTFRMTPGGAQQWFHVIPDLTCLGKIIGGGLPVGACGGRADIMAAFDATKQGPAIPHGGTFNANPLTMQAGLATMRQLTPDAYDRLNDNGLAFRHQLEEMARSYGVPIHISGIASFFGMQLSDRPVTDYRSAQAQNTVLRQKLFLHLLNHGIYVGNKMVGNLSVPMGRSELDHFVEAWEAFLHKVR
ncbi:MAG TPA: aspartate aminotransferase family protein [Candidatus Tectomicrobia bacterium]|jgi:glutamate-1-semialdehyde 2,1-aminomutase